MDESIIKSYGRFVGGKKEELEKIVAKYSDGMIYAAYLTLNDFDTAEDVMEEVLVELAVKRPRFASDAELAVYLYRNTLKAAGACKDRVKKQPAKQKLFDIVKPLDEGEWLAKYIFNNPGEEYYPSLFKDMSKGMKIIVFLSESQKLDRASVAAVTRCDNSFISNVTASWRQRVSASDKAQNADEQERTEQP